MEVVRYCKIVPQAPFETDHMAYIQQGATEASRHAVRISSMRQPMSHDAPEDLILPDLHRNTAAADTDVTITAAYATHLRLLDKTALTKGNLRSKPVSVFEGRSAFAADPFGQLVPPYPTGADVARLVMPYRKAVSMDRSPYLARLLIMSHIQQLSGLLRANLSHPPTLTTVKKLFDLRFIGVDLAPDSAVQTLREMLSKEFTKFCEQDDVFQKAVASKIGTLGDAKIRTALQNIFPKTREAIGEYVKSLKAVPLGADESFVDTFAKGNVTATSTLAELCASTEDRLIRAFKIDPEFLAIIEACYARAKHGEEEAADRARRRVLRLQEACEGLDKLHIPADVAEVLKDHFIVIHSRALDSMAASLVIPKFVDLDRYAVKMEAAREDHEAFAHRALACATDGPPTPYSGTAMYLADPFASFLPPLHPLEAKRDDFATIAFETQIEELPYHRRLKAILNLQTAAASIRNILWERTYHEDSYPEHARFVNATVHAHPNPNPDMLLGSDTAQPSANNGTLEAWIDVLKKNLKRLFVAHNAFSKDLEHELKMTTTDLEFAEHMIYTVLTALDGSTINIRDYVERLCDLPLDGDYHDVLDLYHDSMVTAYSTIAELSLLYWHRLFEGIECSPKLIALREQARVKRVEFEAAQQLNRLVLV